MTTRDVQLVGAHDVFRPDRIDDDCFVRLVVQISERRMIRPTATGKLLPIASLHVHAQIPDVLIRHSKLYGKHEDVIAWKVY